jgi:hypothetical protein
MREGVVLAVAISTLLILVAAVRADSRPSYLTAEEIRSQIVGSTLTGQYASGEAWAEYYDPSGEIRGEDRTHGRYRAHYTLTLNFLCFDYDWNDVKDWCANLSKNGNRITLYENDAADQFNAFVALVAGNPFGL